MAEDVAPEIADASTCTVAVPTSGTAAPAQIKENDVPSWVLALITLSPPEMLVLEVL